MPPEETEVQEIAPEVVPFSRGDWKPHAVELLREKKFDDLKPYLRELYAADISDFLGELDPDEALAVFLELGTQIQGEVLLELEERERQELLRLMEPRRIARIIKEMQSDQARDLVAALPRASLSQVLNRLPLEERIVITELLSYPDNTAGSIMAKEFVAVQDKDTVQKAIQTIRSISRETDDIYTVYVLDDEGRYRGHISLQKLILTSPRARLKKLIEEDLVAVPVDMDQEEVANLFTKYNMISAPVVDSDGLMLGRITVDDILTVVREEASEDILHLGGVSADETLSTPLHISSGRRMLWLAVNLVTAFLAASVVRMFQGTIEKLVLLASLMPIVAGMGGNGASQTMAVIIRSIALGDLTPARAGRAFFREVLIGVANGTALGVVTGCAVYLITEDKHTALLVAPIITAAMLINMIVAAVAGTGVPLILRRFNIDPAIASSIFVTTFTDVMGFFSLLGLAWLALAYGL